MRLLVLASTLLGAAVLAAVGCGPSLDKYPPIQGCDNDGGNCSMGAGAGPGPDAGTSSSSGGTGGAQGTSELTGSVQRVNDPTFLNTSGTAVTTAANIYLQSVTGTQLTTMYGGNTGTTFDIKLVPAGFAWLYVQDQSMGGAGIWSTISLWNMPQLGPINLPVIDQAFFTNLLSNLPSIQAKGVSTQASHVVLVVTHQGTGAKGLKVTAGSGSASIVYDIGTGVYSDTATATGAGGVVILVDSGLSGASTIDLTDQASLAVTQVPVFTAGGAVTLVLSEI